MHDRKVIISAFLRAWSHAWDVDSSGHVSKKQLIVGLKVQTNRVTPTASNTLPMTPEATPKQNHDNTI